MLPRSNGNFAVGEAGIQDILDAEEMIDVPVSKILERLYNDYEQTDADLADFMNRYAPGANEEDMENRIRENHPTRDNLMRVAKSTLAELRNNLIEYDLLTIPAEMPDVVVSRMPSYAGAGGMMLTPGPFEYVAKEAYMAINLPQPDWTEEQVETQLRDFNPYSMRLLFGHEAYPGHHTQFYLEKRVTLRASKDHDSDSNSDGWAEYGKYMLVNEIYGKTGPPLPLCCLEGKTRHDRVLHCWIGNPHGTANPGRCSRLAGKKIRPNSPGSLPGFRSGNLLPNSPHLLHWRRNGSQAA